MNAGRIDKPDLIQWICDPGLQNQAGSEPIGGL